MHSRLDPGSSLSVLRMTRPLTSGRGHSVDTLSLDRDSAEKEKKADKQITCSSQLWGMGEFWTSYPSVRARAPYVKLDLVSRPKFGDLGKYLTFGVSLQTNTVPVTLCYT